VKSRSHKKKEGEKFKVGLKEKPEMDGTKRRRGTKCHELKASGDRKPLGVTAEAVAGKKRRCPVHYLKKARF